jgi:hypothetical protein
VAGKNPCDHTFKQTGHWDGQEESNGVPRLVSGPILKCTKCDETLYLTWKAVREEGITFTPLEGSSR